MSDLLPIFPLLDSSLLCSDFDGEEIKSNFPEKVIVSILQNFGFLFPRKRLSLSSGSISLFRKHFSLSRKRFS